MMNVNLKRVADEDVVEVPNKYITRSPKTPRLDTEITGSLSQIIFLGLYIDPTLGEFPDLPIGPQFRFSKTNGLFQTLNSCRAMIYFVRDKDALKDKELPQGIPMLLVVFDEEMIGQVKYMSEQKRPEQLISEALRCMVYQMNKKKKLLEKEMKMMHSSVVEFQRCVMAVIRRLPLNFTLEDFEKAFRSTYGPDVSTFHFKDMRSVLVAVPTVLEKGETFSYVPSKPIYDEMGLQKMQDEIYEVIKDFQGPFGVKAVKTAYFSRYWEEICFREFDSRSITTFLLDHPAIEPTVADGSGRPFKISDCFDMKSEQRKSEKLKALQARILKVVNEFSMPFIAKGIEPAYEKRFKEKMLSPAEFGYESLLELLKDHPDLEEVGAPDFFDVVCFKVKTKHGQATHFDPNYMIWLLFEIENSNSAYNRHISQPFPLSGAIDSAWDEFLPQIFDFLTKRRSYKYFLVDGLEWLYKPSENERNSLDVDAEGHEDEEQRDEQIGRVMRFLGGKASVDILQRTFNVMFKRELSISDVVAMVSSNSEDYRFAWLTKDSWGEYAKSSYVVDKRFHGSDGVEQNMRRFTQALNDCGGDASFFNVIKRWEFISGLHVYSSQFMKRVFACESLEEVRELFSNKVLFMESPQKEVGEISLRIQNKYPIHRTEMEEGTRRLLEILKDSNVKQKMTYYDVRRKYREKYGVDFDVYEFWRYFEVTQHRYLAPLLAKTPIRASGVILVYFWLDENEEEEQNEQNENRQSHVDEPNRSRKREADEPTEQSLKKKVADVVTEAEENGGEGCSVAAKETIEEAPVAKTLENEVEDVYSKKNTSKFKEEAVQTEPDVLPSVPMDTASSFVPPPPVALAPTSKHAPLGNLVAQMLDYAEYKGKNTEKLGTKILKMIIEGSE